MVNNLDALVFPERYWMGTKHLYSGSAFEIMDFRESMDKNDEEIHLDIRFIVA